jgi:hypothetical protein
MANAKIAMASGITMGAWVIRELAAQRTDPIITSPQIRHAASRHRFSGGRFCPLGTFDLRKSQTAKRMNDRKRMTADI